MEQHEINKKIYILHFMLQGIQLCLDLNIVKKVIPLVFIEKIPKSENYVVGVMNIGGKGVPVIDLALRLELNRINIYSLDTPIILCQQGMYETGIVVDKILGIELIENDLLQTNQNFLDKHSAVSGVIHINDELVLMLDAKMVLDKDVSINNSVIMSHNLR